MAISFDENYREYREYIVELDLALQPEQGVQKNVYS